MRDYSRVSSTPVCLCIFLTNLCNDCCALFQSEITVMYQVHLFVYVFLTNLCNDCCALFQSEIIVVYQVHLFVYVFF